MHQVFNDRSVLFLGCDPDREEYKNFFQKFAVNSKVECQKLPEFDSYAIFLCVFYSGFIINMFI